MDKRAYLRLLFYCIICLCIIVSILLWKQYTYYNDGLKYQKKESYIKAIDSYSMSVYTHIPFSPFENKAIKNILKLAERFNSINKVKYELYCYERLRSSIYGSRWLFIPHKKILKEIEPKIAKIKTELLLKDGYKKSYKDTYNELMYIMTTDISPNPIYSLISIILFFLFIAITIIAIIKSSNKDTFIFKKFMLYFPLIVVVFILWAITLYMA